MISWNKTSFDGDNVINFGKVRALHKLYHYSDKISSIIAEPSSFILQWRRISSVTLWLEKTSGLILRRTDNCPRLNFTNQRILNYILCQLKCVGSRKWQVEWLRRVPKKKACINFTLFKRDWIRWIRNYHNRLSGRYVHVMILMCWQIVTKFNQFSSFNSNGKKLAYCSSLECPVWGSIFAIDWSDNLRGGRCQKRR